METKSFIKGKTLKGRKGLELSLCKNWRFVLIKHGGAYYHVHPCQLMKEKVTSQAMHKQEHIRVSVKAVLPVIVLMKQKTAM